MNLHIALIDDDEDDRLFFREALNSSGVDASLIEYENSESFLKQLEDPNASVPDFVFLDINMPRTDGYSVLREIRRYSHYAKTRVIMFTTSDEAEDINRAAEFNASGFTTKPTDYKILEQTIKDVVAHFEVNPNQHRFYTTVNIAE